MTEPIPFSKYASRSPQGVLKKGLTRTAAKPDRKQGFAQVTEDMFPQFRPRDRLLLLILMRSGLVTTRRNGGWVQLPDVVIQPIGLLRRNRRSETVRHWVAAGVLETRLPGPGKALEYRLLPVAQWRHS
jgi:hypothetical protein